MFLTRRKQHILPLATLIKRFSSNLLANNSFKPSRNRRNFSSISFDSSFKVMVKQNNNNCSYCFHSNQPAFTQQYKVKHFSTSNTTNVNMIDKTKALKTASENDATIVRVNKGIAMVCGISRREAEKFILDKKVRINGDLLSNFSTKIDLEKDEIRVDGEHKIFNKKKMLKSRIWLCNKLSGELITAADPLGRPTIFDRFEAMNIPNARSLKYIGRLDRNTSGLILFTNDGKLKRFMENPKLSYITRTYQVTIEGEIQTSWLKWLQKGATIDNIKYRPMRITVLRSGSDGSKLNELEMTLTEGKKNEIRKVLRAGGMPVKKLQRLQYGPYRIDGLNPGDVIEATVNQNFLKQAKFTNIILKKEKKKRREGKKRQKQSKYHHNQRQRRSGNNVVRNNNYDNNKSNYNNLSFTL